MREKYCQPVSKEKKPNLYNHGAAVVITRWEGLCAYLAKRLYTAARERWENSAIKFHASSLAAQMVVSKCTSKCC